MISKFGWGLFLLLTFVISLTISWIALSKVDFAYSYLYETIDVPAHIDRYATKNIKNKKHFELTSKAERVVLFHQTIQSIESHGVGLDSISYIDQTTQKPIQLYTDAEVIHLQDVANLIDVLKWVASALAIFWLFNILVLWRKRSHIPNSKQLLLSTLLILGVSGVVLSLGPEAIFNQLHIWVFPENHQWFFYYEESLMSTMMKAPDLFAYIAGVMALVSLFITALLLKGISLLLQK